jgi:hypothetical protein
MPSSSTDQVFPVFIVVWAGLGIASSAFFYLSKNASLKRKIWPPASIAASVLFLAFVWTRGIPASEFIFVVPFVALITFINLRVMKFCDACGRTVMNQNPFSLPKYCSKCGAALDK